jgi:DNA invertase Pin-like site-specific DNA recombinase
MNKHIAIYLRVSSQKRQDFKSQQPDLERWAAVQDIPVVIYRDKFTGRTMDRPGWNKLQAAIDRGEVVKVCCWRLDRLGRTAKGLTALFVDLQERGVGLVSLREGIDLSTPAGRMLANMLASVAQFETECRAERVLAGQAAARENGKTWGGRKPGTRVRVTEEKERAIKSMHKQGEKIAAIARATELSRPTVYAVLRG